MTPSRWQQVESIFNAAMQREPDARGAYVKDVCAGDAELRREVESLLRRDSLDDFFGQVTLTSLLQRAWE